MFGMGTGVTSLYDHRKLDFGCSRATSIEYEVAYERMQHCRQHQIKAFMVKSNDRLVLVSYRASLLFHIQPINVVIYHGSSGRTHLVVGFSLICFQRLSFPDLATQRCPWQDNWYTRGQCFPVLSY